MSNICERTGKFQYESKSVAESVLKHKQERLKTRKNKSNRKESKEIGSYKCEFCQHWHHFGKSKI